mgnify:CR=1 FL=1
MDIAKLRRALDEAATAVRARSPLAPRAGIVLGTGLGALENPVADEAKLG